MAQVDPQVAFQLYFQRMIHDIYTQTNATIQQVNDYMYQLQMSMLMSQSQSFQIHQQQPSYQVPMQMQPQPCLFFNLMPPQIPTFQAPIQQSQAPAPVVQSVATTPVIVRQPPTPPREVPRPTKLEIPDPPVIKLRAKAKEPQGSLSQPPSTRNSLIDELRNCGGRKSLRKVVPKKDSPKKENHTPVWLKSRERKSVTPPATFDTLEALLLAKDQQPKSMPNLRRLTRGDSDDRKSIDSTASDESLGLRIKPKPPTDTNVAIAVKAALNSEALPPSEDASSHTSSTEEIPSKALEPPLGFTSHKQLNPDGPEPPHGWQLLMWTIRKVGKFLKKHPDGKEDEEMVNWEVVHHKSQA